MFAAEVRTRACDKDNNYLTDSVPGHYCSEITTEPLNSR